MLKNITTQDLREELRRREIVEEKEKKRNCKHVNTKDSYMSNSQSVHYYTQCLDCGHTFNEYVEPA